MPDKELIVDQFLTQHYGWSNHNTLRQIFEKHGLKQILRDFYQYLEYDPPFIKKRGKYETTQG